MEPAHASSLLPENLEVLDLRAYFVVKCHLPNFVHGFLMLDCFAPAQLLDQPRFLVEEVIGVVVALDDQLVWSFHHVWYQVYDDPPEEFKLVFVICDSHVIQIILRVWHFVDQGELALMWYGH